MKHWACLAIATLACSVSLFGQQKVIILGTAIESGTGLPIPGAKAVLHYNTSPVPLDTAIADATGSFRLSAEEPYRYSVEVTAPGFSDTIYTGNGDGLNIDQAAFDKGSDGKPFATFTVALPHASSIVGRIRDADTSKPLGTLTVRVLRFGSMAGMRRLFEETIVFTEDDGTFRVEPLGSGEYILEIQNRNPLTKEEEKSPKRYPRIYWPSGDPETQDVIKLRQGAEFNIGTLEYSKMVLPKVLATIDWKCTPESQFQMTITQRIAKALLDRPRDSGVCGHPFPLAELSPGSYTVEVTALEKAMPRGTTEINVEEGRDLEFVLKPIVVEPVRISGKITCDCDRSPEFEKQRWQVALQQRVEQNLGAAFQAESDGTFEGVVQLSGSARLHVMEFKAGTMDFRTDHYVKRVLVNGTDVNPLGEIPIVSGTLEILLSDNGATIAGSILKEGKPADARVVAMVARWPVEKGGEFNFQNFRTAPVDPSGSFRISSLSPGTYRVACVTVTSMLMAGRPGSGIGLDLAWFDSGQTVTVAEKESRSVIFDSKEPCATPQPQ
jgi:hypothetical protein